jgi:hypothetical protein
VSSTEPSRAAGEAAARAASADGRPVAADDVETLVGPFPKYADSAGGFCVIVALQARERPDVAAFDAWPVDEAAAGRRDAGGRPTLR